MPWKFQFVLPNINLEAPIEMRHMALVPVTDERVLTLITERPALDQFLGRFKDAAGYRKRPTVLITLDRLSRNIRTPEALAGFRDAVALSVITRARASLLVYGTGHQRILYTNSFELYPWVFREPNLVWLETPAHRQLDEVKGFHGQVFPEVPVQTIEERDIDRPLLDKLFKEWTIRFKTAKPTLRSIALFRSLNVANSAARMPGTIPVTVYDAGRLMTSWASAFEILVHPGGQGHVQLLYRVYDLLEKVEWQTEFCRTQAFPTYSSKTPRGLATWLYGEIAQIRNRFIHGSPVSINDLIAPGTKSGIWLHAAPLYRLALTAYLGLSQPIKWPPPTRKKAHATAYEKWWKISSYQGHAEQAIRKAQPELTTAKPRRKYLVGGPPPLQ